MATIEIEPADVIRLMQQYLKENNLFKTLQSLQEETSVSLNTVDSVETFVNDINSGHWDVVLKVVKLLKLPDNKLIDLYEQIALELIELRETRAANWLIHKTEPMIKLKSTSIDRYLHLQNLLGRNFFDYKEAYRDGNTKERRRKAIADTLKKEVNVVPPQRLLTLIGDALKWQKHEGVLPSSASIDIFTGKAHMVHAEEETYPTTLHKHCIKPLRGVGDEFGPIFVCCAEFSPEGHYIVVGYPTGLVEIRNATTGRIASDLKYQAQKNFIVTPSKSAALSICFSASEMLAVGDRAGDISIWRLSTGQLVQLFKSAHLKSVSCILFHKNGKEILSGGHDLTVKLHGMRSNRTIRDFRGHRSFVKAIAFSRDDNYVITGSSDCTVKIWNARTAQMLSEYRGPAKVHTIVMLQNFKSDIFLIGDESNCITLIDLEAKVRTRLCEEQSNDKEEAEEDTATNDENDHEKAEVTSFCNVCASPKGGWIYAVDRQHIYCFSYSTKRVQKKLLANEDSSFELLGIRHHPFLNLVATYDTHGSMKLWKP